MDMYLHRMLLEAVGGVLGWTDLFVSRVELEILPGLPVWTDS